MAFPSSHLRVLHCPQIIAGNPSKLAAGERAHGSKSEVYYVEGNAYVFPSKDDHHLPAADFGAKAWRNRWTIFRKAKHSNVVHYNFGSTITWNEKPVTARDSLVRRLSKNLLNAFLWAMREAELSILRLSGVKLFVTYQGSDGRDRAYHLTHFPITHCQVIVQDAEESSREELKQRRIRQIARHVDGISSVNPDLLRTLPGMARFVPYTTILLEDFIFAADPGRRVRRIVHAPSKLDFKGTRYVMEAVERLKAEGAEFEFVLIHGLPWKEARAMYESADLLVDQLLVGWYGGVGVELMALGTPVMCYIREEDLTYLPQDMRRDMPILRATPDDVYLRIKEFLAWDQTRYLEERRRARAYVEKWHDPRSIAAWTLARYSQQGADPFPKFDPGSV